MRVHWQIEFDRFSDHMFGLNGLTVYRIPSECSTENYENWNQKQPNTKVDHCNQGRKIK